jgi:molybdopterin/thiamine biosynthesis adenylyltransferase
MLDGNDHERISRERYDRQLNIPGWNLKAQRRIRASRVGIAGVGGLGSPAALYLTAAGIGALSICDSHAVDISNLNRQILYTTADIGAEKTGRAKERLAELNPEVEIETFQGRLKDDNIDGFFAGCDMILDCLDNLESRLMLNRYCWHSGKPLLHAGIREFYGELYLVNPPNTPCLACFLPESEKKKEGPPPVSGPVAGVLGSMQAVEALKFLGKIAPSGCMGRLLLIDLVSLGIEDVPISRRHSCPVCAANTMYQAGE